MSAFKIEKPQSFLDFNVFPDTTMDHLELNDCNDTIDGICPNTKTVEDCIKICKDSEICDAGYFVRTSKGNFCAPLRNYSEQNTVPGYRLRRKDFYPEMKDVESTFFLDKKYKYPPDMANCLFFLDNLQIKSVNTGTLIKGNDDLDVMQFLPLIEARSFIEQYIPVKCGDNVAINIPNTSMLLRASENGVKWLMRASEVNSPSNTFRIHTVDSKVGDRMFYGQKFYFTYFGQILGYDEGVLKILNTDYESAVKEDKNVLFELVPKVQVYYCDKFECKSISLQDTESDGECSRYKGKIVDRNPSCFGMCKEKKKNYTWILLFFLFLTLLVLVFIIYKKSK